MNDLHNGLTYQNHIILTLIMLISAYFILFQVKLGYLSRTLTYTSDQKPGRGDVSEVCVCVCCRCVSMYAYFYAFLCDFVRTSFLWVSGGEPIIITERGNTKHLFSKKEGEGT